MLLTHNQDVFRDRLSALEHLTEEAKSKKNKFKVCQYILEASEIRIQMGDFLTAKDNLSEVLALTNLLSDKESRMWAETYMGWIFMQEGYWETAVDHFFRVLSFDYDKVSFIPQCFISRIYVERENYEKSGMYLSKADLTAAVFDSPSNQMQLSITRGIYYRFLGKYRTSLQHFNEAYSYARLYKYPYVEVTTLLECSMVWSDNGVHTEALRLTIDGLETAKAYGLKFLEAGCAIRMADALIGLERFDEAEKILLEYEKLTREHSFSKLCLGCKEMRCIVYVEQGKTKKAKALEIEIVEDKEALDVSSTDKILEILNNKEKELRFLLQKNRAAVQQLEDLENLKKIVAHDLKEPLRNIGGFAGLLGRKMKDRIEPEELDYLDVINKATKRMDDSLTALLRYLTVSNENTEFTEQRLGHIIERAIGFVNPQYGLVSTKIDYEECANQYILCDANSIHVVFKELFENTMKFHMSPSNVSIKIRCEEETECHVISVEDNGSGIAPDYHDRIFNLFTRLDRQYDGFGVGLSIIRKIIRQHGGTVSLESDENQGARFIMTINKVK